ncbi:hypothetical protein N431DRAFT_161770 [Stipitochalara longipes BDJ]|nr:hypothetical protein N431DRAFT_161770 [Stipitochalara longipes BDJ]
MARPVTSNLLGTWSPFVSSGRGLLLAACAAAKSPTPKSHESHASTLSRHFPPSPGGLPRCVWKSVPLNPANRTRLCHAAPRISTRVLMGQPIDRFYALRSKRQFRRRESLL